MMSNIMLTGLYNKEKVYVNAILAYIMQCNTLGMKFHIKVLGNYVLFEEVFTVFHFVTFDEKCHLAYLARVLRVPELIRPGISSVRIK